MYCNSVAFAARADKGVDLQIGNVLAESGFTLLLKISDLEDINGRGRNSPNGPYGGRQPESN